MNLLDPDEHQFIIYWCREGLECIIPIDKDRYMQDVANVLSDVDTPSYEKELNSEIHMLDLRAQINGHRAYEGYILTTHSIEEDTIRKLFDESPQIIVDLIREKGIKLYGSTGSSRKVIV